VGGGVGENGRGGFVKNFIISRLNAHRFQFLKMFTHTSTDFYPKSPERKFNLSQQSENKRLKQWLCLVRKDFHIFISQKSQKFEILS
jgi:hypothetical protein